MSGGETSADSPVFRPLTDPALLREAYGWSSSAPGWFRAALDSWNMGFDDCARRLICGAGAVGIFDARVMIGMCGMWPLEGAGVIPGVMEIYLLLRRGASLKSS
jgi:hypothetical protein